MEHRLTSQENGDENTKYDIFVLELDYNIVNIGIEITRYKSPMQNEQLCINLNKKELHSFIGTLLHVQQKMKGSV